MNSAKSDPTAIVKQWMDLGLKTVTRSLEMTNQILLQAPEPLADNMDQARTSVYQSLRRVVRMSRPAYGVGRALGRFPTDFMRELDCRMKSGKTQNWLLPITLPSALVSVSAGQAQRLLPLILAVRPSSLAEVIRLLQEMDVDLDLFLSLGYETEMAQLEDVLALDPANPRARLDLANLYMKCGLFDEVEAVLHSIADTADLAQAAVHERMVAAWHGGRYKHALELGERIATGSRCDVTHYWMWLAAEKLKSGLQQPPKVIQPKAGMAATGLELEEVSTAMGLVKTSGGRGIAVFDATGDGYLDVVVAGSHSGLSFFRNRGDGAFEDASLGSGLESCVYAFGVTAVDYNNDGWVDLFVSGIGFTNGAGVLFRNNGDGTFRDVTAEAGLEIWEPTFSATWLDTNGNGFLDLFLANTFAGPMGSVASNRLFLNNGDGTFTDATRASGLWDQSYASQGATWGDFRNCGRQDLFISNTGPPQLYQNQGDGTFIERGAQAGLTANAIGFSAVTCDIDNDGWLDVVQFVWSPMSDAVHYSMHGKRPRGVPTLKIWRNNRDGTFTDIAEQLGVTGAWMAMSGNLGDINNNGFLDIVQGNGAVFMDHIAGPTLLENDGRRFRDVSRSAGLSPFGKGHGACLADLTGDGRLHLLMGNGGFYPADLMSTKVYRPKTLPGGYLNVRLEGVRCNRDALGARLVLHVGERRLHRLVSLGSGFGSMPGEQHFGLADAQAVDALEVTWPDGRRELKRKPPINTTIKLIQGEPGWGFVYGEG